MVEPQAVLFLAPATWYASLGAMRSLGRLGARVYGLKHDGVSPASLSRYCSGTVAAGRSGRPDGESGAIIDELLSAARQLGGRPLLLAGTDEWAVFISDHREPLADLYSYPLPPPELVRDLASKDGLYRVATRHGFPTPRIAAPESREEAVTLASSWQYPVMVKPIVSRPDIQAKAVARNRAELLAAYDLIEEDPAAPNVMFQEYIPGGDEDVWMFDGYFNRESRCLLAFTGQKLRQQPAHMGHTSLGICRDNPALIKATADFLSAAGYRGVVDIGFRFDSRDEAYKIIDVNPRVGGNFRQFVDSSGLDVVRAQFLDLAGHKVPKRASYEGRRWLKEDSDLVAYRQYRRQDGLRLGQWLHSWLHVEERVLFSASDPLPFLAAMLLVARDTLVGRWRRLVGRVMARARMAPQQRPAKILP